MTEWQLVWLFPIKWALIGIFAFTYIWGGRKEKFVRRFLGGGLLTIGLIGLSALDYKFDWRVAGALVCLFLSLSLGYGGDDLKTKLIRRFIYGFLLGFCGLSIGVLSDRFTLGIFQFCLAISASLILGIFNPDDAVDEEALIAVLSTVFLPFMVN